LHGTKPKIFTLSSDYQNRQKVKLAEKSLNDTQRNIAK